VQRGPRLSLWTTLFAIILSYFSTFWSYGYTRLARKVKRYANVTEGADLQSKEVKKQAVRRTLHTGMTVNVIGLGTALLGLQAMVGMLVRFWFLSHCWRRLISGTKGFAGIYRVPGSQLISWDAGMKVGKTECILLALYYMISFHSSFLPPWASSASSICQPYNLL
jgi:hypothetical protein